MSLALVTDKAAEAERIDSCRCSPAWPARACCAAGGRTCQRRTKDCSAAPIAAGIRAAEHDILSANAVDLTPANKGGQDRRVPRPADPHRSRRGSHRASRRDIAALPDPVGRVLASFTRPNGLVIERVATPLGVIGVIFESRPNVTADAGALCLKAGNATILRAGSDSFESAMAIRRRDGNGITRRWPPGGRDSAGADALTGRRRRDADGGSKTRSTYLCHAAARALSRACRAIRNLRSGDRT